MNPDASRPPRDRPLSLREPQVAAFHAGRIHALRRPPGHMLATARPGDRFWIREPFHLPEKWRGLSPVAAAGLGAWPVWPDGAARPPGTGRRRFARELPRAWHRAHLVVTAIETGVPLQAIGDDEIRAEGFFTRASFAAAWDANLSLSDAACAWRHAPLVALIRFEPVAAPLPERIAP